MQKERVDLLAIFSSLQIIKIAWIFGKEININFYKKAPKIIYLDGKLVSITAYRGHLGESKISLIKNSYIKQQIYFDDNELKNNKNTSYKNIFFNQFKVDNLLVLQNFDDDITRFNKAITRYDSNSFITILSENNLKIKNDYYKILNVIEY